MRTTTIHTRTTHQDSFGDWFVSCSCGWDGDYYAGHATRTQALGEGDVHLATFMARESSSAGFDRKHFHFINGADTSCLQLTHCPSICSCAIDQCDAVVSA